MTPLAFLNAVLPDAGSYCLAGIHNGIIEQLFVPTREALVDVAGALNEGVDAYFACSSYDPGAIAETPEGAPKRTADNVLLIKAFWMDMDVGESTKAAPKYADQNTAILALREFCKELKLPRPLIVSSGYGVHVYWVLDEAIEYATWKPIANKLKAVCRAKGLRIDRKCTADAARILRLPGTHNYKDPDHPQPVEVLMPKYKAVDALRFAELLSAVETPSVSTDGAPSALPFEKPSYVKGTDATTKHIVGEVAPSSFKAVVASGKCAQITHIVENQAEIPEPLWRAGLSIANVCVDRDEAIHSMSREHPEYNAAKTEQKAAGTAGPYRCTSFEDEWPEGCEGCPMKGKITSPIQLGRIVPLSDNKPQEVVEKDAKTEDERTYTIPSYPFPYIRGANGEVVIIDNSKPEGQHEEIIYPHPFYVVKRMQDTELGETVWMRLHLPLDGVREFSVPLKDVGAKDRFRDAILAQGVAVHGPRLDKLMNYVMRWTQELQKMQKTEVIRTQFGWTEDDTFVIGDREIRADGVFYSPPASATLNVCNMLVKQGTVEGWKRMADYHDGPGVEARAFALFTTFGAPLMHLTRIKGGVINLMSRESGRGKTTIQQLINAAWGDPDRLLVQKDDTNNARIHRMGVLNSLPVTVDEVTNMSNTDASDFMYAATSGRGKNRMNASSNSERVNNTSWCTLIVTSSNTSFEEKLRQMKASPDGELMRLIELFIEADERNDKEFTDELFSGLNDHYGVVGEVYMQYVVKNLDKVRTMLAEVQKAIDSDASLTQRERIWSTIAAVNITGATIAKSLGLHSIDVDRVAKWVKAYLMQAREESIKQARESGVDILGTYLDLHRRHTLLINTKSASGVPTMPLFDGETALHIRAELDTKQVFIASSHLRQWCAQQHVSMHDLVGDLKRAGVLTDFTKKRLGAGTKHPTTPVNCLRLIDPEAKVLAFGVEDEQPNLSIVKRA